MVAAAIVARQTGRSNIVAYPGYCHVHKTIKPEDVAPSILARAGVPAAADLPGHPLATLFRPGSLETLTVATYGPRVAPPETRAPSTDREYLEKLKSLGYLK